MKNLLNIIALTLLILPLQVSNCIQLKKSDNPIVTAYFFSDLDIFKIKQDIETNTKHYCTSVSFRVIKTTPT